MNLPPLKFFEADELTIPMEFVASEKVVRVDLRRGSLRARR